MTISFQNITINGNVIHLSLPNNKLGLNVKTAKLIYNECKVTVRRVLKCSVNEEAQNLYEITAIKNVNYDCIVSEAFSKDILNYKIKIKCKSILAKEKTENVWNNFIGLKEQCIIIKHVVEVCMVSNHDKC